METTAIKLFVYETEDGRKPYSEWFDALQDKKSKGVIQARLNRVRLGNFGDCKPVGEEVFGPTIGDVNMSKRADYETELLKSLEDPEQAIAYLNAALEDGDLGVFLLALQDVIKASPLGMVGTSKKSKLERTHLYRMLSEEGNPEMKSLSSVLGTLGFQFQISHKKLQENSPS